MTFKDWLVDIKSKGLICERYLPLVDAARSRKQYMDVVLDTNGLAFLCDMREKGYGLPYDIMCSEFKSYLNGRYIHTKTKLDGSYTTSMYCDVEDPIEITINTTLTGLFRCTCVVNVPKNTSCRLYVDGGSVVNIHTAEGSRCYVDLWDGGLVTFDDDSDVRIKHVKVDE